MIAFLVTLLGLGLIVLVLVDTFETLVLPRTITERFRLTKVFYRTTWRPWSAVGEWLSEGIRRERFLGIFGPLSLLMLLGFWAAVLILGFGLVQWGVGVRTGAAHDFTELAEELYLSGTTFFTLGLGDVKPETVLARVATVAEAGIGFGFLAVVIGYLPVVYGGFSRRELLVSRLDIRAGSPPSAGELLRHHGHRENARDLDALLSDCEKWAAELLEVHLSYPVLCLYRSQHRDQSWLAALTAILDTCALLVVGVDGVESRQAPITFAMARRAILDIAHIFEFPPGPPDNPDRLPAEDLEKLRKLLAGAKAPLREGPAADLRLTELRATYEPSAHILSRFTLMALPPWMPAAPAEEADCADGGAPPPPESAADRLTSVEDNVTDPAVV